MCLRWTRRRLVGRESAERRKSAESHSAGGVFPGTGETRPDSLLPSIWFPCTIGLAEPMHARIWSTHVWECFGESAQIKSSKERPQLLWRNFRSNCGALGLRSGSWKQARSFDSREQRLDDNRLRVDGFVKVRWVAESQMGEWIGEWDQFLRLPITFDCSWVWDSLPHCCCMKHFISLGHFMPRQVVERRK